MASGISRSGREVEALFRAITGAAKSERPADGDAILDGHFIELKKASSDTLNQVRATKYITLVAYDTRDDLWYVVPAHEVVRLVSRKSRGQHTENPFESATLSIRQLSRFGVSDSSQLKSAVLSAVEASSRYSTVESEMTRILVESRFLAATSSQRVLEALARANQEADGSSHSPTED